MRARCQPEPIAPFRIYPDAVRLARYAVRRPSSGMAPVRTCDDVERLFAHLADLPAETVAVAYLDRDWRVLGLRHGPAGSVDAAAVPIRAIARDAVALDAARIVMAHNHPSGDPKPSRADIEITRLLADAGRKLGVTLHDHLIFAAKGHASMKALGLM